MNIVFFTRLLVCCCTCLMLGLPAKATAQTTLDKPVFLSVPTDTVSKPFNAFLLQPQHTLGIGVSIVTSDVFADIYQYNPGTMVSVFYGYRFTSVVGIELSAHLLEATRVGDDIMPSGQQRPLVPVQLQFRQDYRLAHSLNGSLTAVLTPFSETADWSRLQVGIGASIRLAGLMSIKSHINRNPRNIPDLPSGDVFQVAYTRQTALGVNAHVEYWLPLGGVVDMGFRLHGQIFFPPVLVSGDRIPITTSLQRIDKPTPTSIDDIAIGAVGLGVFFRLGL